MSLLEETFVGPQLNPRLAWFNPPTTFTLGARGLELQPSAGTDLWQRTHYGFRVDSAPALLAKAAGDFSLETSLAFDPLHQYDQAGLLVRLSPDCWLKTSIEFEGGLEASRLGAVVTNRGWSDWSTQNVAATLRSARYRIRRRNGDYLVEHAADDGEWLQLRVAHLEEDDGQAPVYAGIYACSPKQAGLSVRFRWLRLEDEGGPA